MAQINKKGEPTVTQIEMTDGVLIPKKNNSKLFSSWRITFIFALSCVIILPLLSFIPGLPELTAKRIKIDFFEETLPLLVDVEEGEYTLLQDSYFKKETFFSKTYRLKKNLTINEKEEVYKLLRSAGYIKRIPYAEIVKIALITKIERIPKQMNKTRFENEILRQLSSSDKKIVRSSYTLEGDKYILKSSLYKNKIGENKEQRQNSKNKQLQRTSLLLAKIKKTEYNDFLGSKIIKIEPSGLFVTFEVTIFAIFFASLIGLLTGLGQVSNNLFINRSTGIYVELIRGIPLLVQLIFIYFALGKILHLEGIVAAIVALSICYGAYMGEIFRAGIQSIPPGQMEAAMALGLTRGQALRHVILPQTMKVVMPPIGNEFIAMLKDSSLVSAIALPDLLRRGREYVSRTFLSLETFLMIALIYLVITLILSRLVGIMEERMKRNER